MKEFRIGRGSGNDVVIDGHHRTVSRDHAELVATDDGRYYLTDRGSRHGTFRRRDGRWTRIRQEYVAPDEAVRLGDYQTTPRDLARELPEERMRAVLPAGEFRIVAGLAGLVVQENRDDRPTGPVERHPETGELIRKS